jgi:hypothetical protein
MIGTVQWVQNKSKILSWRLKRIKIWVNRNSYSRILKTSARYYKTWTSPSVQVLPVWHCWSGRCRNRDSNRNFIRMTRRIRNSSSKSRADGRHCSEVSSCNVMSDERVFLFQFQFCLHIWICLLDDQYSLVHCQPLELELAVTSFTARCIELLKRMQCRP